jgi:hypothetical protein
MRTTIDIDQRLLERAKALALKESRTLSAIVGSALAAYIEGQRGPTHEHPFELLVRGSVGGRFPSLAEMNASEDE